MGAIGEIISQELTNAISQMRLNAREQKKIVSGKTINSLSKMVFDTGKSAEGYIYAVHYIYTLDYGRGPAKRAGTPAEKRQFVANLMQWCRARGIHSELDDKQLERVANYLRWRINTFGTVQYQRGEKKNIISQPIEELIKRLEQQLPEAVMTEINKQI